MWRSDLIIIKKNRAKRDNEIVSVDMAVWNTVRKWGKELEYGCARNWISRIVWLKAGIWKLRGTRGLFEKGRGAVLDI